MEKRIKVKPDWLSDEDWLAYNRHWDQKQGIEGVSDKPRITKNWEALAGAIEHLGVVLSFDSFSGKVSIRGLGNEYDGEISDKAIRCLRYTLIEQMVKQTPGTATLTEVCFRLAEKNSYHPVKQWFQRIQWDEQPRLQTWLTRYLGVPDTPLVRKMGELWLVAGVRRILAPGTKFDHVLLLQGKTGLGKSSALRILAHRDEWFTDSFPPFDDPRAQAEAMQGKLIIEYSELAGMRKADGEKIKAFLSRQAERARPAYGRIVVETGRQCIFGASTEEPDCLQDLTNRRWWPVAVGEIDQQGLTDAHEQLWAEAVAIESEGLPVSLPEELWPDATETQLEFTKAPPYSEALAKIVGSGDGAFPCAELRVWLDIPLVAWPTCYYHAGKAIRFLGFRRVKAGKPCHGVARLEWLYVRGSNYNDVPTISRYWD